jgi:outer membrane protein assembly factor BamB
MMRPALCLACAALLSGCGLFSEDETPLPGDRIPVRSINQEQMLDPALAGSIGDLGPARPLADWPQRNGVSSRAPGHIDGPIGLSPQWRTDIGAGSGSSGRITSPPVVEGGRVFTLDAASRVSAVDAASGRLLWQQPVIPDGQQARSGFGGGLGVTDGRLIVTTGFGEVLALSVTDGTIIWRQTLGAPIRSGPALDDGRIVVVTRDNAAFGLRAETGDFLWNLPGTATTAPGVLAAASPAMSSGIAVLPFTSGEVVAVRATTGRVVWADALAGGRRGLARATINDISGDPVISGVGVFAANQSGQMVAIDARTGRRGWFRSFGSSNPAWAVGETLFVIDDQAQLRRLASANGQTIWMTALPEYEDDRRRTAVVYGGPVVAGGRIFLTSSDDAILVFDPATGRQLESVPLPGGSSTGPVIAGGSLYVVADNGVLHAFR